ncbi:MAG: uroporphyrinogen decarboxylase family protein, partial [Verrucomicrobiia bacterium]
MTSLERVKRALKHEQVDRVPRLLYEEVVGYTQPIARLLASHCAPELPRDYFRMDLTRVLPRPTRLPRERFSPWLGKTAQDVIANGLVDEWGVVRKPEGAHELVRIESPLRHLQGIAELEKYPWPDLDQDYRFETVAGEVGVLHGRGFAVVGYAGSVFERAWYLRGFEQMFVDLAVNASFADALLGRTAAFQRQAAVRFAKAGVDIVLLGDDIAGQRGLLMSLSTWRRHLKPHLKATVAAVKSANRDVFVCYHSDGNVESAVPDL